jgi:ribulose-phosphate 3-epimerase
LCCTHVCASVTLQVDGGVDANTVIIAAEYGANVIVAGTAILGAQEPGEAIRTLRAAVDKAAAAS